MSPLDIAVGWGPMSDSAVLADLDIWQSGRFYFWQYDDEPPIPTQDIESHSANWHLVPANSDVWRKLRGLRVGDVVKLDGMLVNLENPEVGTMTTSLTRDDTGAGACEIIYVEKAIDHGAAKKNGETQRRSIMLQLLSFPDSSPGTYFRIERAMFRRMISALPSAMRT